MNWIARALVVGGLVACDKSPADTAGAAAIPGPSAAPAVQSSASTKAIASAASASSGPTSWSGTYHSAVATLSVPAEWSKTHWSDTKTTAGIGDGTMTLAVEAPSRRVAGTIEGALGPAVIEGELSDGDLSATIRRKDPADHGFTGTLLAKVSGDRAEGTMNVSLGAASALRSATFTLSRGAGTAGSP